MSVCAIDIQAISPDTQAGGLAGCADEAGVVHLARTKQQEDDFARLAMKHPEEVNAIKLPHT